MYFKSGPGKDQLRFILPLTSDHIGSSPIVHSAERSRSIFESVFATSHELTGLIMSEEAWLDVLQIGPREGPTSIHPSTDLKSPTALVRHLEEILLMSLLDSLSDWFQP